MGRRGPGRAVAGDRRDRQTGGPDPSLAGWPHIPPTFAECKNAALGWTSASARSGHEHCWNGGSHGVGHVSTVQRRRGHRGDPHARRRTSSREAPVRLRMGAQGAHRPAEEHAAHLRRPQGPFSETRGGRSRAGGARGPAEGAVPRRETGLRPRRGGLLVEVPADLLPRRAVGVRPQSPQGLRQLRGRSPPRQSSHLQLRVSPITGWIHWPAFSSPSIWRTPSGSSSRTRTSLSKDSRPSRASSIYCWRSFSRAADRGGVPTGTSWTTAADVS